MRPRKLTEWVKAVAEEMCVGGVKRKPKLLVCTATVGGGCKKRRKKDGSNPGGGEKHNRVIRTVGPAGVQNQGGGE